METSTSEDEKYLKYWNIVKENPSDFTSWTCLLQTVDQQNILEKGREVYEEFFKYYPYCYGYWKKYADLEKKNGNMDLAKKVFESGVAAIPLSIDLWIHYINFMSQSSKEGEEDPNVMPNLYTQAIKAAGLEFRSDKLYDSYIDWEKSQGNLRNVTAIYDRLLSTPTQQYIKHFVKFKEFVNSNKPADILSPEEYLKFLGEVESIPPGVSLAGDSDNAMPEAAPPGVEEETESEAVVPPGDSEMTNNEEGSDDKHKIDNEGKEQSSDKRESGEADEIRKKIIESREPVFKKNEEEVKRRWNYEETIKRPYFHVKPLEKLQLRNWREYLDFQMREGNHDKICTLFERCLIACALYEDFWQKYIKYLTRQDDSEDQLNAVRHVYERACNIHLTNKPNIILSWAAFEEKHHNISKAREILKSLDEKVPGIAMVKLRQAGLERRHGDPARAVEIFKEEIEKAVFPDEKSFFAVKCARVLVNSLDDKDSAKDVIRQALDNDKGNKKLYLHLLDLELASKPIDEDKIEELCDLVTNCELLTAEFKQGFQQRKLEIFEDFGSNINNITKAYESYQKDFKIKPGIVTTKRKTREESDAESKAKVQKAEEIDQVSSATANAYYSQSTYANSDTSAAANTYGYTPAPAVNQWSQYNAQNANAYYGWYNAYGAYPQQPTQ